MKLLVLLVILGHLMAQAASAATVGGLVSDLFVATAAFGGFLGFLWLAFKALSWLGIGGVAMAHWRRGQPQPSIEEWLEDPTKRATHRSAGRVAMWHQRLAHQFDQRLRERWRGQPVTPDMLEQQGMPSGGQSSLGLKGPLVRTLSRLARLEPTKPHGRKPLAPHGSISIPLLVVLGAWAAVALTLGAVVGWSGLPPFLEKVPGAWVALGSTWYFLGFELPGWGLALAGVVAWGGRRLLPRISAALRRGVVVLALLASLFAAGSTVQAPKPPASQPPIVTAPQSPVLDAYYRTLRELSTPSEADWRGLQSEFFFGSTDEPFYRFLPPIQNRGGAMVGVGFQQNWTLAVNARARGIVFDIDPRKTEAMVPFFGRLMELAPTRRELLSFLFNMDLTDGDVTRLLGSNRLELPTAGEQIIGRVPVEERLRTFMRLLGLFEQDILPRVEQEYGAAIAGDLREWFLSIFVPRGFGVWREVYDFLSDHSEAVGVPAEQRGHGTWLSSEENYQWVRDAWLRGWFSGVTGDVRGPSVGRLAQWLRERGEEVSVLYLSNVDGWVRSGIARPGQAAEGPSGNRLTYANLAQLPLRPDALALVSHQPLSAVGPIPRVRPFSRMRWLHEYVNARDNLTIELIEDALGFANPVRFLWPGSLRLMDVVNEAEERQRYYRLLEDVQASPDVFRALTPEQFTRWAAERAPGLETDDEAFRAVVAVLVEAGWIQPPALADQPPQPRGALQVPPGWDLEEGNAFALGGVEAGHAASRGSPHHSASGWKGNSSARKGNSSWWSGKLFRRIVGSVIFTLALPTLASAATVLGSGFTFADVVTQWVGPVLALAGVVALGVGLAWQARGAWQSEETERELHDKLLQLFLTKGFQIMRKRVGTLSAIRAMDRWEFARRLGARPIADDHPLLKTWPLFTITRRGWETIQRLRTDLEFPRTLGDDDRARLFIHLSQRPEVTAPGIYYNEAGIRAMEVDRPAFASKSGFGHELFEQLADELGLQDEAFRWVLSDNHPLVLEAHLRFADLLGAEEPSLVRGLIARKIDGLAFGSLNLLVTWRGELDDQFFERLRAALSRVEHTLKELQAQASTTNFHDEAQTVWNIATLLSFKDRLTQPFHDWWTCLTSFVRRHRKVVVLAAVLASALVFATEPSSAASLLGGFDGRWLAVLAQHVWSVVRAIPAIAWALIGSMGVALGFAVQQAAGPMRLPRVGGGRRPGGQEPPRSGGRRTDESSGAGGGAGGRGSGNGGAAGPAGGLWGWGPPVRPGRMLSRLATSPVITKARSAAEGVVMCFRSALVWLWEPIRGPP